MKKGYVFQDMSNEKVGNYTFTIKGLFREEKDELAGLLIITKSDVSDDRQGELQILKDRLK